MTVAPPELLASVTGTVGVPMPGVEVEIVDSHDRAVAVGMTGQVRIKTAQMPSAYHDDPANSARSFRAGWFYPGDVGRLDAFGRLFHLGRADDMMIFNGINIAPAEIERVMLAHPAVADAVAMPLKRAIIHEVPICAIALGAGASASSDELMAWARQRLGVRSPKHIVLMDAIPRNPMGKPLRGQILQEVTDSLSQSPRTTNRKK
jgi:long-chain acyl-CoA synthetase